MKTNESGQKPKGITAVHTFSGQQLSAEEHQTLLNGPLAAVNDVLEEARKRVEPLSDLPNSR